MDTTKLQAALIAAGCESIPFAMAGESYTTKVADLPDASLIRVLTYGKRMANDYVNSAKATSDTPVEELAAGWIKRAMDGTLGQGGGSRTSLDPMQRAIREVVVEYLKASGMKTNEARKEAKKPKLAFRNLLAGKIAMAQGGPTANDDDVDAAFLVNWEKVKTAAHAIVEASAGLSIDL